MGIIDYFVKKTKTYKSLKDKFDASEAMLINCRNKLAVSRRNDTPKDPVTGKFIKD